MISMKPALLTVEDVKMFIIEAMKRDKTFTRIELASYLNITLYTLDKYIKEGLPWFGKRTRKQFVLSDVQKWLIKNNYS